MNAQLDDSAGAILRRSVEGIGIAVHLAKRTTEVRTDENGKMSGIVFSDGSSIDCDMLVIAAGIRPNVGLAQRAGLTVERAIVVDDHMRSVDDDNIYVVGECAQHRGQQGQSHEEDLRSAQGYSSFVAARAGPRAPVTPGDAPSSRRRPSS